MEYVPDLGNAINAEVAREFICASMQILVRRETTYGTEASGCARIPTLHHNKRKKSGEEIGVECRKVQEKIKP